MAEQSQAGRSRAQDMVMRMRAKGPKTFELQLLHPRRERLPASGERCSREVLCALHALKVPKLKEERRILDDLLRTNLQAFGDRNAEKRRTAIPTICETYIV
jgi:hypothetical protein